MLNEAYINAKKKGEAEYKTRINKNQSPYLLSLDRILSHEKVTTNEQNLGLINIPLERIAGTRNSSRTPSFASNFMPILAENSEFAGKWKTLYNAHLTEGIREPISACEYMNKYYVIEGNKRVSVLKYAKAVSIPGYVTRIIPKRDDSLEINLYYEYMDFYSFSAVNVLYFSKPGSYKDFCDYLGCEYGKPWDTDFRRSVESLFYRFKKAYYSIKQNKTSKVVADDAFLFFLKSFGYDEMLSCSTKELTAKTENLSESFLKLNAQDIIHLVTHPQREEKRLIQKVLLASNRKIKCAFIYHSTTAMSGWTFEHEKGRRNLLDRMTGEIETIVYEGIFNDTDCTEAAKDAINKDCEVIFITSPRFIDSAIKLSAEFPDKKILCCALNNFTGIARTYSGRLYEAKHLVGLLAGMLANDTIGYIADYPIAGAIAEINAFALGVKATNPNATIKLLWNSKVGENAFDTLIDEGIEYILCREVMAKEYDSKLFGLCRIKDKSPIYIASPYWIWGRFYESILRTVQNGVWNSTDSKKAFGSVNYWWGMSSGVVDVMYSRSISKETLRILEMVRSQLISGDYKVFFGDITDNEGKNHSGKDGLAQEDIIKMDWLCDNVIGSIPKAEELRDSTKDIIKAIGVTRE